MPLWGRIVVEPVVCKVARSGALHPDGDLIRPFQPGRDIVGELLRSTFSAR